MQKGWEGDLLFIQYFDREYLPSGMWNDMGVSGNEVFMNPTDDGVKSCIESISESYKEKMNQ
jgi:raffinose/stachyose/melibiose transport system substrate-binding protein